MINKHILQKKRSIHSFCIWCVWLRQTVACVKLKIYYIFWNTQLSAKGCMGQTQLMWITLYGLSRCNCPWLDSNPGTLLSVATCVTWLGHLLHFGNFFKAFGNNHFGNLCKVVEICHFLSEIIFGQPLKTFGDFLLVKLYNATTTALICHLYPQTWCWLRRQSSSWVRGSRAGRSATWRRRRWPREGCSRPPCSSRTGRRCSPWCESGNQ